MTDVSEDQKQLYEETLSKMRVKLKKEGRVLLNTLEIEELKSISPTLLTEQFERELSVGMEKMQRNSTYGAFPEYVPDLDVTMMYPRTVEPLKLNLQGMYGSHAKKNNDLD
ncbi:hypothetical protein AGENTSMITH_103 [Bacillus phage vB_BspM_AgentSmith]|nr:hypothetical protein AGENTSMITH_103 [Bacillus phage vB_BspM_AgentSmith]